MFAIGASVADGGTAVVPAFAVTVAVAACVLVVVEPVGAAGSEIVASEVAVPSAASGLE